MVGKLNKVLLLLVLLGAAAVVGFVAINSGNAGQEGVVELAEGGRGTSKPLRVSLRRPVRIAGADTLMIHLTTEGNSSKLSYGGGSETRNVLFLSREDKAARWLFKGHHRLIVEATQMPEEKSNSENDHVARAIYFEYVEQDTNGDSSLSKTDAATIGFAMPDGTGFVTVLKNVTQVFSHEMADREHISIVFQSGTKVRHARIAVAGFKIISDQAVIDVPNAI